MKTNKKGAVALKCDGPFFLCHQNPVDSYSSLRRLLSRPWDKGRTPNPFSDAPETI